MMDLKEIIKWFIPCFHILQMRKVKMNARLTCLCLFLLLNFRPGFGAKVDSVELSKLNKTKNVDLSLINGKLTSDQSGYLFGNFMKKADTTLMDTPIGRTFGRPFKKMAQALIPLVFQVGAASTWAVVAAIVGVKTLLVTLIILKLLLIAGAAKLGAIFGQKGHHSADWQVPHPSQKEIHLHIHNGHGHPEIHDESSIASWSRNSGAAVAQESNNVKVLFDPHAGGPQTISTPYGNYVKVEPSNVLTTSSLL